MTIPFIAGAISRFDAIKCFRRKFLLPILVATGVVALIASQGRGEEATPASADSMVATINNEPVEAGEYRLIMERKTSEVFTYMKQHHDLDDHFGYWSESSGPEGPLAKLREMVLNELVRIKVYQGLAKEKGLLQETTFTNFKAQFERENARRREATRLGQVIYGPSQYRMVSYYYILFGDLDYKLKEALAKELEPKIPEADIGRFYEENKPAFANRSLADAKPRIVTLLGKKEAEKQLAALCLAAKAKVDEPSLRAIVPRVDNEPGQIK